MGLRERIQEERVKIATSPAVQLAVQTARDAQIKIEQEWKTQSKIEALAAKQEAEEKTALTADLNNLLEVAAARELLTEVREDWGVGKVDRKPLQIRDVSDFLAAYSHNDHQSLDLILPHKTPAMLLALRYRFRDTESATLSGGREGLYLHEHELALHVIVGREAGLPFVATLAGLQRSGSRLGRAYQYGSREPYPKLREDTSLCINHGQPETIFPTDPEKSKKILEDQLFEICSTLESPLSFADKAKGRVLHEWSLPAYARNTVSPAWYKRIPSRILDGIVEFDELTHH